MDQPLCLCVSTHLRRLRCAGRDRREPAEPARSKWGIRWAPAALAGPGWSWCWAWCAPSAGWSCSGPVHTWWPAGAATWRNSERETFQRAATEARTDQRVGAGAGLKAQPNAGFAVSSTCASQKSSWRAAACCCPPPGPGDSCPCGWRSWCRLLPAPGSKRWPRPRWSRCFPEGPRRSAVDAGRGRRQNEPEGKQMLIFAALTAFRTKPTMHLIVKKNNVSS